MSEGGTYQVSTRRQRSIEAKKESAGVDLRLEQAREEEDYRIKPDLLQKFTN
jgi:hypothetical protein